MSDPNQSPLKDAAMQILLSVLGTFITAILFSLFSGAQASDVYRCGSTHTYSDTPCGPQAVKIASPAAQPAALRSTRIKPGMPEWEALDALKADGWPVRQIILESSEGTYKQIVVGRHIQNKWYVFTRDGVVTSVLW